MDTFKVIKITWLYVAATNGCYYDYDQAKSCCWRGQSYRSPHLWSIARFLYNKVGFQWGFFVSCGSQKKYAIRWRSNQVTAVRAANARWHPTAITCTRDGAAPTWPLFAMFQKKCYRCSRLHRTKDKEHAMPRGRAYILRDHTSVVFKGRWAG
jgi:hypothetical protein